MKLLHAEVNAHTLRVFDATPEVNWSDISDLVESFYSFNALLMKKIPEAYTNPDLDNVRVLNYGKSEKFTIRSHAVR